MTAPAGAIVALHVDLVASVAVDDVIETESGRRYSVIAVRVQECGKHKGRQHLRCIVMPADEPQHGEKTHRIRWYKRGRARR